MAISKQSQSGTTNNSLNAIASVSPTQLYGVGTTDGHTLLLSGDGKRGRKIHHFPMKEFYPVFPQMLQGIFYIW